MADGVADDAPAIRAMFAAALNENRPMFVPAGVYRLSSVEIDTQVIRLTSAGASYWLEGAGRGKAIFRLGDNVNSVLFYCGNLTGFVLRDMTFDLRKDMQSAGSFTTILNSSNIRFDGLEILNPFGNGIYLEGPNNNVDIHNCRIVGARTHTGSGNRSSGHGIAFSGSEKGHTRNFRISNIDTLDCDGSGLNISHGEYGVVNNIVSVVESFKHDTGYAAVRCSNQCSKVNISNVLGVGTSRTLFLTTAAYINASNIIGENNWSDTIFIERHDNPSVNSHINLDNVISINANQSGARDIAAIRLSRVSGVSLGKMTIDKNDGLLAYGIRETDGSRNELTARPNISGAAIEISGASLSKRWTEDDKYTPTLMTDERAPRGIVYGEQIGRWSRFGDQATVWFTISLASRGKGGVGAVRISLPFNVHRSHGGSGTVEMHRIMSPLGTTTAVVQAIKGTEYAIILINGAGNANSILQWSDLPSEMCWISGNVTFLSQS